MRFYFDSKARGWANLMGLCIVGSISIGIVSAAQGQDSGRPVTQRALLKELSAEFAARLAARQGDSYSQLLATTDPRMQRLLNSPGLKLMYIDERGHPEFYINTALAAAQTISTDQVWPGAVHGFNLTGDTTGGELHIWDDGLPLTTHDELIGRISLAEGGSVSDHSTHVAGIMISSGVDPTARGMSHCVLAAHDYADDQSEMSWFASINETMISNHSYSFARGWSNLEDIDGDGNRDWTWWGDTSVSTAEDYKFGFYDDAAAAWDEIAYAAPYYTIVKSAGNDRSDAGPGNGQPHYHLDGTDLVLYTDLHPADGPFDSLPQMSTAKNIITVGSVRDLPRGWSHPILVLPSTFSSYGPADDGRIKPDIVANGDVVWSADSLANNAYINKSGTSMSAPCIASSLNLLRKQYADYWGEEPLSSTLKAILIHTADEAGSNTGPDYQFGWGLMNTLKAAEIIEADATDFGRHIIEETLEPGDVDTYRFYFGGGSELRATLVWTDPAGTPPGASVDPTTSMLVNDLDLYMVPPIDVPAAPRSPWVLDPVNPSNAAVHAENNIDNVEQIQWSTSFPLVDAGCYEIQVSHDGTLTGGSQAYSLVLSHNNPCEITGQAEFSDIFTGRLFGDNDSRGISLVDYNHDFYLDMLEIQQGLGRLYQNLGSNIYRIIEIPELNLPGPWGLDATWADVDRDGDLDLYMANNGFANQLLLNNGVDGFIDATPPLLADEGAARAAAWADFDGDGNLDLYLSNLGSANRMFQSLGNGEFVEVQMPTPAISSMGIAWCDYDVDGDPDLYVVNASGPNWLFRNESGQGFVNVADGPIADPGNGRGASWGDFNNDGYLDLYVTNHQGPNRLFRNDAGNFVEVQTPLLQDTGDGRSATWGDIDLDGDLDLYLVNHGQPNRLFLNQGQSGFELGALSVQDSGLGRGASMGDIDNDGDLDIAATSDSGDGEKNRLYLNLKGAENRWIHVKLAGTSTNSEGLGARVELHTGGRVQVREIGTGAGYLGQNPAVAVFGLGEDLMADTIRVIWPNGQVQELQDVDANFWVTFEEDGTSSVNSSPNPSSQALHQLFTCSPNPIGQQASLRFALGSAVEVELTIYDASGRRVRTLVDEELAAGIHSRVWDRADDRGRVVGSGVYLIRLTAGNEIHTGKAIIVD